MTKIAAAANQKYASIRPLLSIFYVNILYYTYGSETMTEFLRFNYDYE